MNPSVLKIYKQSGDAHLGQTLTRLAQLAAAAHRYDSAISLEQLPPREVMGRTQPLDSSTVVQPARTDAGAIHREVDR